MTTITVHRIDATDMHTFRVRCAHCKHTALIEVGKWKSRGGRAACPNPNCNRDWGDTGIALAGVVASIGQIQDTKNPDVFIQVEVETGTIAPVPTLPRQS